MCEKGPWYLWQLAKGFRAFSLTWDLILVNNNRNTTLPWYSYNKPMTLVLNRYSSRKKQHNLWHLSWESQWGGQKKKKNQWRYIKVFLTLSDTALLVRQVGGTGWCASTGISHVTTIVWVQNCYKDFHIKKVLISFNHKVLFRSRFLIRKWLCNRIKLD